MVLSTVGVDFQRCMQCASGGSVMAKRAGAFMTKLVARVKCGIRAKPAPHRAGGVTTPPRGVRRAAHEQPAAQPASCHYSPPCTHPDTSRQPHLGGGPASPERDKARNSSRPGMPELLLVGNSGKMQRGRAENATVIPASGLHPNRLQ